MAESIFHFLHFDPDEEDALISSEYLFLVPIFVALCVIIPSVFCTDVRKPKTD